MRGVEKGKVEKGKKRTTVEKGDFQDGVKGEERIKIRWKCVQREQETEATKIELWNMKLRLDDLPVWLNGWLESR